MTESNQESRPDMEEIVSLCKRRGFIFQSSEIYGGMAGAWDYGPLGVELKNNIKRAWWKSVVQGRDDMVGMDTSILMHPQVWVASGHVATFADPMVDCRSCQARFRADEIEGDVCPNCGAKGQLTEPRMFNLLFKTFAGPVENEASTVYLRPETAQGMFVNFANVLAATRRKLPFGMAQIGKSFRNEVTPRHFIFRTREFEQMEIEYFVRPQEAERWHQYWMEERLRWYVDLGIRPENLRLFAHAKEDLAHYAAACSDVEYQFPMGWMELEGIANRTDFDLRQHSEASGVNLTYFDEEAGEHITPYIIEPSAGVDRPLLAFIVDAYRQEEVRGEKRVLLRLHPSLAPVKATVLPLSRNERLVPKAREVWALLRPHFMTQYDDAQSIGRRYRRQDEIGTPYCVTVDFDTLEDEAVTIRERDSMDQVRVPIAGLVEALREKLPPC